MPKAKEGRSMAFFRKLYLYSYNFWLPEEILKPFQSFHCAGWLYLLTALRPGRPLTSMCIKSLLQ